MKFKLMANKIININREASEILFEIGRTIGVNGDLSAYLESLTDSELSTVSNLFTGIDYDKIHGSWVEFISGEIKRRITVRRNTKLDNLGI